MWLIYKNIKFGKELVENLYYNSITNFLSIRMNKRFGDKLLSNEKLIKEMYQNYMDIARVTTGLCLSLRVS